MSQTTKGLEALAARAEAKSAALDGEPMRVLMGAMAKDMVVRMFQRATSFTPGDVPDLNPVYRLAKQKKWGHAYPILYASGAMLRSMYGVAARTGDAMWALRVGFEGQHPSGGVSNAALADVHIKGSSRLPARDFTAISPGWETPWLQRINTLLKDAAPWATPHSSRFRRSPPARWCQEQGQRPSPPRKSSSPSCAA